MRRTVAALGLVLLLAQAALAQTKDGFQWDPHKKRAPGVGDRWFTTEEEAQKAKIKIVMPGQEPQNQTQNQQVSSRLVHQVLAVADGKITKERIKVERWKASFDGDEDSSLEGKVVTVETTGDKKNAKLDNEEGVSDRAKAWAEKSFTKNADDQGEDKILPKTPVKDGEEWKIDPKLISDSMLEGTEIDEKESSASGKLTNVRVEDGVHVGKVEIAIKIKLKKVPGAPMEWKEGGFLEMTVGGDRCLEPLKSRKATMKMDGKLKGKTEQETEMGAMSVKMDVTMSAATEEGDLPPGEQTADEPKTEKKPEPKKDEPKKDEPKKKSPF